MEENTRKCIEEFKAEVENTRKVMVAQVTDKVASIFEKELASVDGYFTEFRMSVNIDEKKIPVLEKELEEAVGLMQKVHMIEERVV